MMGGGGTSAVLEPSTYLCEMFGCLRRPWSV
jgi:hypothetical protein